MGWCVPLPLFFCAADLESQCHSKCPFPIQRGHDLKIPGISGAVVFQEGFVLDLASISKPHCGSRQSGDILIIEASAGSKIIVITNLFFWSLSSIEMRCHSFR